MRKSAELRKAEIVAAVLCLADRIGPDRVTTAAVASEVGITHAALFRHFPTKAAMWKTVAEEAVGKMSAAWDEELRQADTPVARLKALISAQIEQIEATPALPMLLFSRELNVENKELRTAFRDALDSYRSRLIREIAAGQTAGTLRNDLIARDAAFLLTSLVQGVAIRWSLGARNFTLRKEALRLLGIQLQLLGTTKDHHA